MLHALPAAALLVLSAPLLAQDVLLEWDGPIAAPFYGSATGAAGDVDGDAYADLWIGDPFGGGGRGLAELRSGRTGKSLLTLLGSAPGSEFGSALAGGADVDGDGQLDVVVGEPSSGGGRVLVYSGLAGDLWLQFDSADGNAQLGRAVALAGDVNVDGFVDVAAGAPQEGSVRSGAVHVWSGRDGTPLRSWFGLEVDSQLGTSLAAAGDVDADGRADIVAGAPQTQIASGYVDVWSGFDGSLLHRLWGDMDDDRFGASVAGAGDVDGDGHDDVLVGVPGLDVSAVDAGALMVYSGLTGSRLQVVHGEQGGDLFGTDVSSAGDVDNDGDLDVAGVSLPFFGGGVGVYDASSGQQHFWMPALGEGSFEALSGLDVTGGQDSNTDGVVDLGVGVARRIISPEPGFGRVVSTLELPWSKLDSGALAGSGDLLPFLDGVGVWQPGGPASLRLYDGLGSTSVFVVLGLDVLESPFKGGTLIPSPDLIVTGLVTDGDGRFEVPTPMPQVLPPGAQIVYQAWLEDPAAPLGFSASNGLVLSHP